MFRINFPDHGLSCSGFHIPDAVLLVKMSVFHVPDTCGGRFAGKNPKVDPEHGTAPRSHSRLSPGLERPF